MERLWRFALLMLLVALGVHVGTALAQSYPSRPIRVVIPMAPGGAMDIIARLIGPKMANALSQPVVVENRAGAAGRIGEDAVAKAPPDGHTILIDVSGLAISPALYRNLPFDPAKDFIPVTQLTASSLALVANPKVPVTSIRELIVLAKSKPGGLNYGHSGVGSLAHVSMEQLNISAGIDILAVPYKGLGLVSNAVIAGEVDVALVALAASLPAIKDGRLRALGMNGARSAALPDVPTYAEAGIDAGDVSWHGLFVPAKTPRNIVELIQREAVKALNVPDVRDRIRAMYMEIVGSTPEEFDARFKVDIVKFARLVKEARIPLQN